VHWQQTTQTRTDKKVVSFAAQDIDQPVDMLIRFLQAFDESKQLLNQFKNKIFKPLFEFFNDDPKRQLTRALASVIWRWEGLVVPGPVNHRLFSPKSADALYHVETSVKPRDSQFNLILRLVPDLALKAFEALCLAQQWRSKIGPWGYTRELKYIHTKWIHEKREANNPATERTQRRKFEFPSCQDKLKTLQRKMVDPESKLIGSSTGMKELWRETGTLSDRFGDIHRRIDVKTEPLERSKLARDLSKQKDYITTLHEEMKKEQKDIQNIRAQLIKADINYKYSKEKEMTKLLEDDLVESFYRCAQLRKEICKAEQEYNDQMTRHYSANPRLNSVRRGIDSAKSEQFSLTKRLLTMGDRQTRQEKSFVTASDNFSLLKEELRKSKLTKQVLLRQMLQPRHEESQRNRTMLRF
jgi:hypothetical protein